MSEIVKTEAVVLNKLDYGDTSVIVSLFTKEFGKLSAILKGGRSPKSKVGTTVDPPNLLQVILYNKSTRDLQLISGAEIIEHYPAIKSDLDKLKFAFAIIELVKKLTPEHETNERLFRGLTRILNLLESSDEMPHILFGRFFIFFLEILGYELSLNTCGSCGRGILSNSSNAYNFNIGLICENCRDVHLESFYLNSELFEYLFCLKHGKIIKNVNPLTSEKSILFLEKYLKFHVPDFKGIQSLQIYK